jgi:hypothetical protein
LLAFPEDFFAFTCVFSICDSNVEAGNNMREVSNLKPQKVGPACALTGGLRAKTGTALASNAPATRFGAGSNPARRPMEWREASA